MRLFLAINLPAEERDRLYTALQPLRAASLPVRWVRPEAIHLTLQFLGEVDGHRVPAILNALREAVGVHPGLALHLGGMGVFPGPARPRVWWMGADGGPVLLRLQKAIEIALAGQGFEPEGRAYTPHITLGRSASSRATHVAMSRATVERWLASVDYEKSVAVRSIELMRSHLQREGARYERVASLPLADSELSMES